MEWARHYGRIYVLNVLLNLIFYSLCLVYSAVILFTIVFHYLRKPSKYSWTVKNRARPQALENPHFGTHKFIQLQNVKLHYVEAGVKEKPLMIFIHGFPDFWYSWRHQIKQFAQDYWIIALDTRGYGDSEKPKGIQFYKLNYLIDDLKNLIDGLERKKCILVGHDWGGVILWLFTMRYPSMVEKYIVLNTPHPKAYRELVCSSFKQFKSSWYIFFYQMPFFPEFCLRMNDMECFRYIFTNDTKKNYILNEGETEAYKFIFGKPGAFTFPVNYYRANFSITLPPQEIAKSLPDDFPKGLLIFGENDKLLAARRLVEKSKEFVPNLETLLISDACHFVHQEEPDKINTAMRHFFQAE
ncbi:epoxide hydrolase 4-like [Cimex lectularius]|uniref:AB hydrolase-1 domain-containing protein n=1 Tax=Cimex lectularius TaxID=79782 RepID=A0A8I6TJ19_CIMLE|nr:epoxide hydrolase 4-like [Cimex lectularius]